MRSRRSIPCDYREEQKYSGKQLTFQPCKPTHRVNIEALPQATLITSVAQYTGLLPDTQKDSRTINTLNS